MNARFHNDACSLSDTPSTEVELLHLYISPRHNYVGYHGHPAGTHPVIEVPELRCIAGRGIEGDRFFDHRDNFKGQITFFADKVYRSASAKNSACGTNRCPPPTRAGGIGCCATRRRQNR